EHLAIGNHGRDDCLIACCPSLDVIPPFFHTPDVGASIMMGIGPIQAEYLAAPALILGGHESLVVGQQVVCLPACFKDRGMHRPTARLCSSWPDLGIIDALQRLLGTEDQASHIPRDMLKALCPAEQITIRGQPAMNRGGHPYDRQHSLDPLWGYLLLD